MPAVSARGLPAVRSSGVERVPLIGVSDLKPRVQTRIPMLPRPEASGSTALIRFATIRAAGTRPLLPHHFGMQRPQCQ
jgi:hypothetical protein